MPLFSTNFSRPGPGVEKDEPRKKGLARYWEIICRDFPDLTRAAALAFLAALPGAGLIAVAIYLKALLFAVLAGALGGMLFFPFYCALHGTVLRTLRDEPGYWWPAYRRMLHDGGKHWILPGAVFGAIMAMQVFIFVLLLGQEGGLLALWGSLLLSVLLSTGFFTWMIPQLVLIELPFRDILKNSLLLFFKHLPQTFQSSAVQLLLWAVTALFMPYSLWLMPVLLWLIPLAGDLIIYNAFDQDFAVEKTLRRNANAVSPEYHAKKSDF